MNKLAEALLEEKTHTYTENGMRAKNTTGNDCLNFFSTIGALRYADKERILSLFSKAYADDMEIAVKTLFYGRDIRGGLGERKVFRTILTFLANNHPDVARKNIHLIPEYGRWDDLYALIGTPVEDDMWECMKTQFKKDTAAYLNDEPISNLVKWIRTPHTRGKRSKELGKLTAKKIGMTTKSFVKIVEKMRRYNKVIESMISSEKYDEIKYSAVPGRAMMRYRKLFQRKDEERFSKYLKDIQTGNKTIHSSTVYPYDIVKNYLTSDSLSADPVLEAQWKALPNYLEEKEYNVLNIVDTSGSMYWNERIPISSAIGLGIYLAERCNGAFKNMFLTFSENTSIQYLKGDSLYEKIRNMSRADWGNNTNIEKALILLLQVARRNEIPQKEMPKALIITSDMEFDAAVSGYDWSFYDNMDTLFEENGYTIPNIIFWNVDSRNDIFHADNSRKGVLLVSGHSPSTFKMIFKCLDMTAMDLMLQTILSERYAPIQV